MPPPAPGLPELLPSAPLAPSPARELSARRAALATRQAERDAAAPVLSAKVSWAPTPPAAARRTRSGGDGSTLSGDAGAAPAVSGGKRSAENAASCGSPASAAAQAAAAAAAAAAVAKRPKPSGLNASEDAVILGYELGTIKHSAYVLLQRAGASGLTVSTIVETATREGLYSWGTCKTPNNSVTAALSQDANFQRVAPSTYALREVLRPVGQAALREAVAARNAAAAVLAAAAGGSGGSGSDGAPLPPKPRASGSRPAKRPSSRPGAHAGGGAAGGDNSASRGGEGGPSRSHNSDTAAADKAAQRSGEVHSRASGAAARAGRASAGAAAAAAACDADVDAAACAAEREATSFVYTRAIYPPPSPPTPEEEKRVAAPAQHSFSHDCSGSRLFDHERPAAAEAVPSPGPSEAHARAVRWRHEAAGARPFAAAQAAAAAAAAAAADAALAANSLPSWVVQAYLTDKSMAVDGDASANGAPPLALPAAAAAVCAC